MSLLDLLNEHILLVEEEYDRGGGEVTVVADTIEQVQTLVHSILKVKKYEFIHKVQRKSLSNELTLTV